MPYLYCPILLFLRRTCAPLEKRIEFAVTANNRIFHSPRLLRELQRGIWASEHFLPHVIITLIFTCFTQGCVTGYAWISWWSLVLFCIFYCYFGINEFKTETTRVRSSCFGFQCEGDERAIPFRANGGLPNVIRTPPWNVEFRISLVHEIQKNIRGESR